MLIFLANANRFVRRVFTGTLAGALFGLIAGVLEGALLGACGGATWALWSSRSFVDGVIFAFNGALAGALVGAFVGALAGSALFFLLELAFPDDEVDFEQSEAFQNGAKFAPFGAGLGVIAGALASRVLGSEAGDVLPMSVSLGWGGAFFFGALACGEEPLLWRALLRCRRRASRAGFSMRVQSRAPFDEPL